MKKTLLFVTLLAVFVNCGCQESQKVWGVGDPDTEWQVYFGNDNGSRIDFVQTRKFNAMVLAFAELVERVKVLEDPDNKRQVPDNSGELPGSDPNTVSRGTTETRK